RNQRYLQGEVVGFRRPLRLYGRSQHGRQIPPQLDLKGLAALVWREHDGVHEAAQRLRGLRPAARLLERLRKLCDLRPVDREPRRGRSEAKWLDRTADRRTIARRDGLGARDRAAGRRTRKRLMRAGGRKAGGGDRRPPQSGFRVSARSTYRTQVPGET